MKKFWLPCFGVLFALVGSVHAQILNPGFENWTAGNPDNWDANNVPPSIILITQSSDAHSGSSALQAAVSFSIPPYLAAGTTGTGFAISSKPSSVNGFVKLALAGGDTFFVSVQCFNGRSLIGVGVYQTGTNASSYTAFSVPINYITSDTPDTIGIAFSIVKPGGVHSGSTFTIDDLSLTSATGIQGPSPAAPASYSLSQNFPNPFNPTTSISYSVPHGGFARLQVQNILGQVVATLVDGEVMAGSHNVQWDGSGMPSGMYFYRLSTSNFTETKKLLLLK